MSFDMLLNLILAGFASLVIVGLIKLHMDEKYKDFNLVDVITCHEGKVSRPALMEIGSWLVATWGFVVLINQGKLTEWYMGAYIGAFVLRAAHAAYLNHQNGLPANK